MANVLSLAVKITGDASGLQKSLTPAERAFQTLSQQVEKTTSVFEPLAQKSEAAARAQEQFNERFAALNQQLQDGLDPREFTRQFEALQQEVQDSAKAFEAAGRIIEANRSPLERYDNEVAQLREQLAAGRIQQETFDRAVVKAGKSLTDAERAARGLDAAIESTSDNTLKFNELSGIFSALPGPLGNVAGRLSGLSSAGEGLGRVFSGGLSQGLASIGTTVAGLINPFTLGLAAVAAFGAGATAVARGLVDLEDRVERLGRLANQLGVSFEFVQVLEEAGNRADVSIEQLSGSFARLQNTLAGADEESKKAASALSRLGVSVEEFGDLSEQQQIELIGERLATIEDPAERSAAAIALFGRSGVQLLPFFNELEGAATDIERLGGSVDDLDRARLADFGAGIDALAVAARGLGNQLLLPFTGLGEGIAQGSAEFLGGINAIVGPIGDVLEPLLSGLGSAIEVVGVVIGGIGRQIGALLSPIGDLAQAFGLVGDSINTAFVDVVRYLVDASVSTTEWLVSFNLLGVIGDNVKLLTDAIGQVSEVISRVATIVTTAFGQLAGTIQQVVSGTVERVTLLVSRFAEFTALADVVRGFASAVTSAFSGLWEGIKSIVGQVGGFIERVLEFAENWLGISREIEQPVQATIEVNAPQAVQLTEDLAKAQESVAEFGNAGVEAFLEYQAQLEDIAELVAEGEYDGEAQQRAIAQATAEFERQRDVLKEQAEEQERLAEAERRRAEEAERAAQRQIDADQRVVDGLLNQIRVDEEFGGDSARARAADNVLSIEREIARVEEEQRKAREAGDQGAADAAASRLAQLDQVAARERDIASGAAAEREAQAKALEDAAKEQERLLEQRRREEERIQQQVAQAQERYAERATEIEAARVDALNSALAGPVQANDLRSAEGAATFLNLASGAEDPAIAEYRKQLKELQGLRRDIQALETQKAEILAGTG